MAEETKVDFDLERFKQLVAHFDNGNQGERSNAFRAVMRMCEKDGRHFCEIAKDAYGNADTGELEEARSQIADLEAQMRSYEDASREFERRAEEISNENAELRYENEQLKNAEQPNAGESDDEIPDVQPTTTDNRATLLVFAVAALLIVVIVGGTILVPNSRSSGYYSNGWQTTFSQPNKGSTLSQAAVAQHRHKSASARILEAANAGNSKAMFMVGAGYAYGQDGFPQDNAEAVKWFRKAGYAGNTQAMANLGQMYQYGEGTPKDVLGAIAWYRQAIISAKSSDDPGAALGRDRLKELGVSIPGKEGAQ